MYIRIGSVEVKLNAFLFALIAAFGIAHSLGKNEKLMDQLREKAAVSKIKKEQAEQKARSLFMTDASGTSMTMDDFGNIDQVLSTLLNHSQNTKKTKKNA